MGKFRVIFAKNVLKDVKGLPNHILEKIKQVTYGLENNPKPIGSLKLTGRGGFRIRIGDYRLLYLVDDDNQMVTITNIKHRRDVYSK